MSNPNNRAKLLSQMRDLQEQVNTIRQSIQMVIGLIERDSSELKTLHLNLDPDILLNSITNTADIVDPRTGETMSVEICGSDNLDGEIYLYIRNVDDKHSYEAYVRLLDDEGNIIGTAWHSRQRFANAIAAKRYVIARNAYASI